MIDFATLQGLTIPEGVVTQIAKDGVVLWALQSNKPVILEVEKITSDTYAGETTYTGEEFILLDIYPKTNGTVNVTYGGLTKTITDTSGAEEPNAQQVFFGTFNGVSDSVATPASGTLTIEGDYVAFEIGSYQKMGSKSASTYYYKGICSIDSFGTISHIPNGAFSGCANLTSVTIPSSVKTIGDYAFNGCTNLTNAIIASNRIGDYAFNNCTNLTSVTIQSSVETIGYSTFSSCYNLKECITNGNNFTFENGALFTSDKKRLVAYPSVVGEYSIPNGVTDIGYAFFGCTNLTSVTIPSSMETIGDHAFYACNNLTSVTIPSSVKTIGDYAFFQCKLESLSIPEGVTNIKEYAFSWAIKDVEQLIIPSTVQYLDNNAFAKYSSSNRNETLVLEVILLPTTPPIVEESDYGNSYGYMLFGDATEVGTEDKLSIIVPKGTLNEYKSAIGWSDFQEYITEAS